MSDEGEDEMSQQDVYAKGVKSLLASGAFSDLTVTCQGNEWKVHKLQLCAQSDYFLKMCNGEFKEAKENVLSLDEEEPQAVEAMLYYLSFGDYTQPSTVGNDLPAIVLDVKMCVLGDKYLIGTLEKTAFENFSKRCSLEWNTANFAAAIRAVYQAEVDDPDLKEVIVETISEHIDRLMVDKTEFPDFHFAMNRVPELGVDILDGLATEGYFKRKKMQTESEWMFECPKCSKTFKHVIPIGSSYSFTGPCNCYMPQAFSWWKHHAV